MSVRAGEEGSIQVSGEGVSKPVRQLRLVVEADDFDEVVEFYRDVLGLSEEFYVESDDDARVVALQAGRATLEIVNTAQRQLIDRLEVGREVRSRFVHILAGIAECLIIVEAVDSESQRVRTVDATFIDDTTIEK